MITISSHARDHVIFSVAEDLPMGFEGEVLKKNYYVDIGASQGVEKGTVLDVFRIVSKSNPYDNKKRVNYKVKIGELEVLHTENGASITQLKQKNDTIKDPLFEINSFMIGDHVKVSVN